MWYLQDLTSKPKYLVTFTVGYNQKKNIDAAMKKVILLFSADPTGTNNLPAFSL